MPRAGSPTSTERGSQKRARRLGQCSLHQRRDPPRMALLHAARFDAKLCTHMAHREKAGRERPHKETPRYPVRQSSEHTDCPFLIGLLHHGCVFLVATASAPFTFSAHRPLHKGAPAMASRSRHAPFDSRPRLAYYKAAWQLTLLGSSARLGQDTRNNNKTPRWQVMGMT